MPVQNDENGADGMNGNSAQDGGRHDGRRQNGPWVEDLLARDRQIIRNAAAERIAGGMYSRIAQEVKEDRNASAFQCRWALVCVGLAALLITAFWIGMPRKSLSPDSHAVVQPVHAVPAPATIKNSEVANAGASSRVPKHLRPRVMAIGPSTRLQAQQMPRQGVFPIEVAANEQERLMMQVAQNHPEQLSAIAEHFADDSRQLEEQRREFEEWLKKEGGTI